MEIKQFHCESFIIILIILIIINLSFTNNQNINDNSISKEEEQNQREIDKLIEDFYNEWDEKMSNYTVEYVYYIILENGMEEKYYENVTTIPTTFRGAYFLSDNSNDRIGFYIKDPNNKVIYSSIRHFSIFELKLNKTGLYTFYFVNRYSKQKEVVTLTMNTGQNNLLTTKELNDTEKKMENLESIIKKFNMEFKLTRDIHTKRFKSKFRFFKIIIYNYYYYRD
mgnify:CR=1 FL=1